MSMVLKIYSLSYFLLSNLQHADVLDPLVVSMKKNAFIIKICYLIMKIDNQIP